MSILDAVLITTKTIGSIQVAVSIEERYSDELTVTDHTVEVGADITDHSYRRPSELTMQCGWSDSDYTALLGALQGIFNGSLPKGDYVDSVYSQLLALQQSRQPFSVTTSRRRYDNMLLTSLSTVTDLKTNSALIVTASMREIIMVESRVTKLPPKSNQLNPASTAETVNMGTKQLVTGNPAPGGAVPPANW
ncbi:hypothetical protein LGM43_26635 [Burkholderia seminalis]|uniref:phage baseplate protein n=1 Tax=Burkholderia seminalis TaxID=488731 RepID=UPI001CF2F7E7|nr:hypothetical protein [Burkholderia seminalis]MCA7953850.1 hypothetical protein [Burkholderia seminalis]